ncbi:MAG: hypothetical protein ACYC6C_05560 [Coriobacteriia bacterium]
MKNILLLLLVLFIVGCKTTQYVPIETKTEVRERIVPVDVPADSSSYFALLECDSLNQIYIKELHEQKTEHVTDTFVLYKNKLLVKFKSAPGELKVIVRDSIIEREVPYPVKGDTQIVYEQYWYQKALMIIGIIALIMLLLYLIIKRYGR